MFIVAVTLIRDVLYHVTYNNGKSTCFLRTVHYTVLVIRVKMKSRQHAGFQSIRRRPQELECRALQHNTANKKVLVTKPISNYLI